jgi:hypothetical protein
MRLAVLCLVAFAVLPSVSRAPLSALHVRVTDSSGFFRINLTA